MLALADTAPGIADLTKGQPALRGIAMLEQRAPQDQHIHTAISASGHRVARQAGGSGGTLPVGRAPRLDPWDTASFKPGDDLRGHLVIEIDAGRGHLVPGLSPRSTVGLLAHTSPLRPAPKQTWLPRNPGGAAESPP